VTVQDVSHIEAIEPAYCLPLKVSSTNDEFQDAEGEGWYAYHDMLKRRNPNARQKGGTGKDTYICSIKAVKLPYC
jgi:hypothetical protein